MTWRSNFLEISDGINPHDDREGRHKEAADLSGSSVRWERERGGSVVAID